MPAKKRTACNPRRARLVFLETPEQGPVHEYGPAPPKAENPISVPTKPLDQNTTTAWVSPQFEQAVELHFPPRRRLRHTSANSSLQSRPGDTSRIPRKPSVCKFPSLSFTQQASTSLLHTQSICARRRPRPQRLLQTPLPESPPPPPQERSSDSAVLPPDIQTPDVSPDHSRSPVPVTADAPTPVSRRRGDPNTPLGNGPGQVLAEDTPEHEYGVRVTWRRRQALMKYLKSRGRLKSSQVLVKR
ncbi:RAD9, HUS1, RAD1-interacting nuclear orphan protein 1 [Gastrophryne carolinensis]